MGLTLNLELPGGGVEMVGVNSTDPGRRVLALLETLRAMHRLPEGLRVFRADSAELDPDASIQGQGLKSGATLVVQDPAEERPRRRWEDEKLVVGREDFDAPGERTGEAVDAQLHPREEREAKAEALKDLANKALKDGGLAASRDLYSVAISWLPPLDSDEQLVAALFGNRSLTHLKLGDWRAAQADAAQALALRPDSVKVRYRLGVASRELGELDAARAAFQEVLRLDPGDRTTLGALAALDAAKASPKSPPPEPPVPEAISWRCAQLRQGHGLPRVADIWQDLDAGREGALRPSHAAGLRHALRDQPPLRRFYREALAAAAGEAGPTARVVLCGVGSCLAAQACAELLRGGALRGAVVVEPCLRLAGLCGEVADGLGVERSSGQIDSEFAIPPVALGPHESEAAAGESPAAVILACDRLSDDLVGERLVASLAAARDAAARRHQRIRCVPSRAQLVCAPLELRCGEAEGWDVSRVNALRFSARPENGAGQTRGASRTSAPRRQSDGWWPLDLDREGATTEVCRLCAEPQVAWSFDFDDAELLSQQRRSTQRTLEVKAACDARMNAMAVWWRLEGPGGASVSSAPAAAGGPGAAWPGKRQAVFYFGFEMGVKEGEALIFLLQLSDACSHLRCELLSPQLTERMGLIRFNYTLRDFSLLEELKRALDLRTNRLMRAVPGTPLARRDKLLRLGPFDTLPGTLEQGVWDSLAGRLRLHAEKPMRGDAPIACVFSHGVFEGTVRWPTPPLAAAAAVPRLPRYFEALSPARCAPFGAALRRALGELGLDKPRVLEVGCGPAPLLALCAAAVGARAWAVEMAPELRELAVETVRESGLEMVFPYKGYSPYSFFGTPRRPEDPGVRVLRAMPSTSLQVML